MRVIGTWAGAGGRYLPVTLGDYVAAWRAVLAAPAGTVFSQGLTGGFRENREQVLEQFRAGLHDRINRRIPDFGVGRKWDPDWQRDTAQVAHSANSRCVLRTRDVPVWLRPRLEHRITEET